MPDTTLLTGGPGTGAATQGTAYLSIDGLSKSYGPVTVVRNVSFEVARGEFLCILGPSGCGKTTLLRLIAGFERADGGIIRQAGREITALPPEARDFGIVFQSYALFPNRDVAGNIAFGLESTGVGRAQRHARVAELLALVSLSEHAAKYPSQLSGGQQQRVALARALALQPGLLLLDEPLSALDANVRAHLRDELRALQRRLDVTALMVTHDQTEALSVADRIIVLNAGRIEQVGSPTALYTSPASLFVARFLGGMNAHPVDALDGSSVQVAGRRWILTEPCASLPPDAQLCIRPAAVVVGDEATGRENRIAMRVADTSFLGDMVRLSLRPDAGPAMDLVADIPFARLGRLPAPGDAITVALPAAQLRVLPGHGHG
jgi:iron(III) transport system ATP-binding protein